MSTRFWLPGSVVGAVLAINIASGGDAIEHRFQQARRALGSASGVVAEGASEIAARFGERDPAAEEPKCRTKVRIRRTYDESRTRTRVVVRRRTCG